MFKQQKYPEAIKDYNEALKRNPKDVRVIYSASISYFSLDCSCIYAMEKGVQFYQHMELLACCRTLNYYVLLALKCPAFWNTGHFDPMPSIVLK